MIGVECEKENSGSSWGADCAQPNLATACSTFTGSGYHPDPPVSGLDCRYRIV